MEIFVLGIIIPVSSLWLLYSAVCIIYPFKPFRKRKHAALSLVSTFMVTLFVAIIFALVEVVTVQQKKVASEDTEEQKPKTTIVDSKPEVPLETTTVSGNQYARKIGRYALLPYDAKNSPKLVRQFGSRLKEIEQLRRSIAEIAIDSGKCDFVESSDLSDRSSLQHLHFWVDCRNRERIRLDEFEIKKKSKVFTQREKAWDESSARTACRESIKSRALIPSELDIHDIFGTSFYEAPVTHNVVLTMNFDAKNAFGVEFPYTAKCYFKPGEVGEIELYARQ